MDIFCDEKLSVGLIEWRDPFLRADKNLKKKHRNIFGSLVKERMRIGSLSGGLIEQRDGCIACPIIDQGATAPML